MDDALGRLETQMVVLTRRIENASRRSTIHRRMDRAAYLIARTIDASGPASVNEIARSLGLDGSTVTRQLAAMEARGFVARDNHPDDGRAWVISLTTVGRAEMSTVRALRRERFALFVDSWSADEVDQFGRLLERLNESMRTTFAEPERDAPARSAAADAPASTAPRSDHRRSVLPTRRPR